MSLILDALSRAEREKRRGPAPDLLAQPQYVPEPPSRRWLLPGAAAIVLGLTVVALLLSVGDVDEDPAVAASDPPAERAPTATVEPVVPVPEAPAPAPEAVTAPAAAAPGDAVRALYADADAEVADGADRDAQGEPVAAAVDEPAVAAEPVAIAAAEPVADPAPTEEEVVDLEQVLREVRIAAANEGLSAHAVPLLAEQSKQFRDSVPTLMYLRHDFAAAGQSTVLINGQTLAVGQRTRGVELREILPDSVILRFDGTDFRLRALNSWVNL